MLIMPEVFGRLPGVHSAARAARRHTSRTPLLIASGILFALLGLTLLSRAHKLSQLHHARALPPDLQMGFDKEEFQNLIVSIVFCTGS